LLNTAAKLFAEHGYHATGIDTIMRVSGVSKTTLYKYFCSKEELILEVLSRRHEELMQLFSDYVEESRLSSPGIAEEEHVLAIFDALHDWINGGCFYGCNFIKASAEYTDPDDPINVVSAAHKKVLSKFIAKLLSDRPSTRNRELADQILMILDGAIIAAHVCHDKKAVIKAKPIVWALLGSSL